MRLTPRQLEKPTLAYHLLPLSTPLPLLPSTCTHNMHVASYPLPGCQPASTSTHVSPSFLLLPPSPPASSIACCLLPAACLPPAASQRALRWPGAAAALARTPPQTSEAAPPPAFRPASSRLTGATSGSSSPTRAA